MDTINKIIVNCETNETEIISLTTNELKALKEEAIKQEELRLAEKAEAEAKAVAKTALLEKLGITVDEAKLLLG
jgi:hypothetical protein